MIDCPSDFNEPETIVQIQHDGEKTPPMRTFCAVSGSLLRAIYQGFGLSLQSVLDAELNAYPSPEQQAKDHDGLIWDIAVFHDLRLVAAIIGQLDGPPTIWRPGVESS